MGRPTKYSREQTLDAAIALVVDGGPASLSVSAVAGSLGAPGASVYHRFASRDVLAGSLWLRSVERFQEGLLASCAGEDPLASAITAARHVVVWSRENLDDAQLLLLHRSSDLLRADWPAELRHRNKHLRSQLDDVMAMLARRLNATSPGARRRIAFAVVDIPYGAVRRPISRGVAPEPGLEDLVEEAARAVLNPLTDSGATQ